MLAFVPAWKDEFVDQSLLSRARQEIADGRFEELNVILPSVRAVESLRKRTDFGLDSIPLGVMFPVMTLIVLLAIAWFLPKKLLTPAGYLHAWVLGAAP